MKRHKFNFNGRIVLASVSLSIIVLFTVSFTHVSDKDISTRYQIAVLWESGTVSGTVNVKYGSVRKLKITSKGYVEGTRFGCKSKDNIRLLLSFDEINANPGSMSTLVTINTIDNPFSFFLRDVNSDFPIYIPEYKVIVTIADDFRDYNTIKRSILDKNLKTKLDIIKDEQETSFVSAAEVTRDQTCPTWLGISRDVRTFQIDYARRDDAREFDIITPRLVSEPVKLPELNYQDANYGFVTGRGQGPVLKVSRNLEDGFLPILCTTIKDEDITYRSICFVSYESSPLTADHVTGTNFLLADSYGYGNMFTESQMKQVDQEKAKMPFQYEEMILYFQVEAENNSNVPRYAWFKTIRPGSGWWSGYKWSFDGKTGFSSYNDGKVFCVSKLEGKPLPDEEMAVLLSPGEKVVFEFFLPHSPVSKERAEKIFDQSFDERHEQCREYWMEKLTNAADIHLPEKRIEEMMKAGLLHLDLVTYGEEPNGTLAPTIGVYSPIGTESAPIIQYYNSVGWENIAKRSLMYFLDKQHEDGLIQNFGGYMVETGAALWSIGEYFRYTRDTIWVKEIKEKLMKSCEFLLRWRAQNLNPDLKGKGYGMISGKVADPEDEYHQFMLNAYAYLGLKRVAEMLTDIDPGYSLKLRNEAESWRQDIRNSLFASMARSPVVPAGDGSWCPTVPPWPEDYGPLSLYVDPANWFSHGTFQVRDVLLGPLYLIFCEVLDPWENTSKMMLKYHTELFYQNNAAFSQPYYSRHAWLELKTNLVKPFLKTYYTTFSALADRETYSFWEHLYHGSPHKTHEEGWFLMETRWMLYMESDDTLKLLPGIPRNWLNDGENIELKNFCSYFGPFNLAVNSNLKEGYIVAKFDYDPKRSPGIVTLHLPHPQGVKPVEVIGGTYLDKTESVIFKPYSGSETVRLIYK
jgi:hypothetical protein